MTSLKRRGYFARVVKKIVWTANVSNILLSKFSLESWQPFIRLLQILPSCVAYPRLFQGLWR
jgi:hypothetical protein